MSIGDDTQTNPDITYIANSVPEFEIPPQQIITGTAITNINGITGPNVTIGGGTSGFSFTPAGSTITLTSPLTTKGDLLVRDATTGIRLPVGANDLVLTADSATAAGVKWASSSVGQAWAAWTPTWTNLSLGNGVVDAKYTQIGKTVFGRLSLVFGTTTIVSGLIEFSFPVTKIAYGGTAATLLGLVRCFDTSSSTTYEGPLSYVGSPALAVVTFAVTGTSITIAATSSTSPFTWATGDEIVTEFFYEST